MIVKQAQEDLMWFKSCLKNSKLIKTLKSIKLVVCDVDGTLTNSNVYVSPEGEGGRYFSTQDGFIVNSVLSAGIELILMSGKGNSSTAHRGKQLGIPERHCITGTTKKAEAIKKIQNDLNIEALQTIMFGDDFLDAQVCQQNVINCFVCPSNSPFYLQQLAKLIIPRPGGKGAFRLFMDLVLYLQEKHFAQELITQSLQ
jgi:3-deoxy-D-manno-octulosonate 8-phosphate phosphatase (KDO 8-P phosphatase)